MGNLYTKYIGTGKQLDPRIILLSRLKRAWGTKPIDFKLIKELQSKLDELELKRKNNKIIKMKNTTLSIKKLGSIAYYQKLRNNNHITS